jgi:hypothetical protein
MRRNACMSDEEEDTYLPVRGVGRRGSDPTGYDIVLEPKLLAEERDNACMSDEEEDTYQMRRRIHTCSPKSVIMLACQMRRRIHTR